MTDEFASELPGERQDAFHQECDELIVSIRTHLSGWEKGQGGEIFSLEAVE